MNATTFIRSFLDLLARHQIEFMVSGSFVSTHYGEPRTTHDLDVVVIAGEPPPYEMFALVEDCRANGWYVPESAYLESAKVGDSSA